MQVAVSKCQARQRSNVREEDVFSDLTPSRSVDGRL